MFAMCKVLTAYVASLCRHGLSVSAGTCSLCVRALACGAGGAGGGGRLRALLRRGALSDSRPLACQLLSLARLHPAATQLALDMMYRLRANEVTHTHAHTYTLHTNFLT